IAAQYRENGQRTALRSGKIDVGFFSFPKTPAQLVRQCDPRNLISMGKNGSAEERNRVKNMIQSGAESNYQRETGFQKEQAKKYFGALCYGALNPDIFSSRYESQLVELNTLNQIWRKLTKPIIAYEKGFAASGEAGTDYLWSIGQFSKNSTFQDWDGAIEWLAWGLSWSLRLGALIALFTGYGALAAPQLFVAAQAVEWIAALLRPMVSALGTMPDVIGFQFDIIIASALGYEAILTQNIDIQALIVEGYALD
ncbi:MAG: hypothetical protein JXA42_08355, partial [Anaerolineales bacterium]|nr:hypothetical protein [Anaerolineales bacterium]